jgi:hypothetical protein
VTAIATLSAGDGQRNTVRKRLQLRLT